MKTPILLALLLLAGACTDAPPTPPDTADVRADIEAQARRFSQAYMDGDLDTLVSIYTEDGVAAPGGRDFIVGHDALRRFWQLPDGRIVSHHQTTSKELIVSGDYAYDWGYYEGAAGPADGEQQSFRGKYVIVWRRDADGVWRMLQDMWNTLPAE